MDEIIVDDTFCIREREDRDTVRSYADVFEQYKGKVDDGVDDAKYPFPPVYVWRRGKQYVLVTGFHRFQAAQQAGMETILVQEFTGGENEAFELAIRDNSKNGQRLSNGNLKVCLEKAFSRYTKTACC